MNAETKTVEQVAADLKTSKWSVLNLIRSGKLRACKPLNGGRSYRILVADLHAYLLASRRESGPHGDRGGIVVPKRRDRRKRGRPYVDPKDRIFS